MSYSFYVIKKDVPSIRFDLVTFVIALTCTIVGGLLIDWNCSTVSRFVDWLQVKVEGQPDFNV